MHLTMCSTPARRQRCSRSFLSLSCCRPCATACMVRLEYKVVNIMCYGEAGTGKTRLMLGEKKVPGIVQLTLETIFSFIEVTPEMEFMVRGSFFEIYNECINDLISDKINLELMNNTRGEIKVKGLTEQVCNKPMDGLSLLTKARSMKSERRSHSELVYTLTVESRPRAAGAVNISTINLIKLSYSDYPPEEAAQGLHKSLEALNEVLQKLSKAGTRKTAEAVPYDDSKLTRYLRTSLEGNSRSAVVCTMSPAYTSYENTMKTFCFAIRARGVILNPKPNTTENKAEALLLQCDDGTRKALVSGEVSDVEALGSLCSGETMDDISDKMEEEIEMSMEIQRRVKQVYEVKKLQEILREHTLDETSLLSMSETELSDPLFGKECAISQAKAEELKDVLVEAEKAYTEELTSECSQELKVVCLLIHRISKTTLRSWNNCRSRCRRVMTSRRRTLTRRTLSWNRHFLFWRHTIKSIAAPKHHNDAPLSSA
eukprot:TRINITY_DN7666_c0_g1_i13.p1 TRINITY_DN7666_c0_g1~~TRINITY_DN7666_c0_g1_i13.p1  ORF type:complete len:486 (+),score=78.09 TRINITY_DN7666_c0_g1_i13:658-2115(+)